MTFSIVLNPVGEIKATRGVLIKRDKNLEAKKVLLFSNNKPNVNILFDFLERLLLENYSSINIIRKEKDNAAAPAPDELIEEVTKGLDYLIYGVSD